MKTKSIVIGVLLGSITITGCVSNVSNSFIRKNGLTTEQKGRELLDNAWNAQGLDKLKNHKTYEFTAYDNWQGIMGGMAKIWPTQKANINLKYSIGSFDGQVSYLDGKEKGGIAGLQSWKYYEQLAGEKLEFKKKHNARRVFGITAFQYFFEMADRLRNAPIVVYGGEKEFNGNSYDLVFVTWEKLKAHKKNDQYLVWINKKNNRIDYTEFTIHDPFLPGGSMLPGSIEYRDYRNIDGVQIPFTQYVYLGGPKKKTSKNLHELTVKSFKFDSFDESILYPNKNLAKMGDAKPE